MTAPTLHAITPTVARPGPTVSSRLLAVLGCFELGREALSLTEIGDAAGLPLSTARRLIIELVQWGALERIDDGRYRVGTRLWRLGTLAAVQRELRETAAPFLQQLCATSGGSAQLVVLDGLAALCLDKVSSLDAVPTKTQIGGKLPLHATAVGKVLLAHSTPTLLRATIANGLERRTPRTIIEPGRLATAVRGVRATGVGYSLEEMTLGAISVASPVTAANGSLVGALGVVTHSRRKPEQLVPAIRSTARRVSDSLR